MRGKDCTPLPDGAAGEQEAAPCLRRRGFLRLAALAFGGLAAAPVLAKSKAAETGKNTVKASAKAAPSAARSAAASKPTVAHKAVSARGYTAQAARIAPGKRVAANKVPSRNERLLARNARATRGVEYKAHLRSQRSRSSFALAEETRAIEAPAIQTTPKSWSPDLAFRNGERALSFYSPNTGEQVRSVFWTPNNGYLGESLKEISWVLRDHRNNEFRLFDPKVLDILYAVQLKMGSGRPTHVICGYRSPETNAWLAHESRGVAKNSYHMQARALDVRMPGASIAQMHRAALSLGAGGVGYYPRSGFIHVDTGPVRSWG